MQIYSFHSDKQVLKWEEPDRFLLLKSHESLNRSLTKRVENFGCERILQESSSSPQKQTQVTASLNKNMISTTTFRVLSQYFDINSDWRRVEGKKPLMPDITLSSIFRNTVLLFPSPQEDGVQKVARKYPWGMIVCMKDLKLYWDNLCDNKRQGMVVEKESLGDPK